MAYKRLEDFVITSLLMLSLGACGLTRSTSELKATIDPLATDFKIGRGIDLLNGSALGDCIQTSASIPAFDAQGKEFYLSIAKVESSQDLYQKMGLSAKSKYFNSHSALAGKTTFSEQFAFNKHSLFLYISVKVTNPIYTITDASLKKDAITLYRTQGARAFRNACGDEFVRSFNSGGEFIAVLQIHSQNESHKKQLEDSIKGSFGQTAGSISFSSNLEKAISQNKSDIYVYQSGGAFEHMNLTADALIKKATNYPATISAANSRPIIAYTASYKTLLNFPGALYDIHEEESILNQLADDDLVLDDLLGEANHIMENQDQWNLDDDYLDNLQNTISQIKQNQKVLQQSAQACVNSLDHCNMPTYSIPVVLSPSAGSGPGPGPGPGTVNGRKCVIWIDSKGVPFLKPYDDDGGPKRKRHELAIGEKYKWEKMGYVKHLTCLEVTGNMQTVRSYLRDPLGYGEDEKKTVEIINN